ncbi:Low molecular weight phosphotyrosine protein phosphatase [Daldinia childiae]|uniref:Low molecular weight phosphotyrosine protein phosphatase n=1 Tax=Daldinia childiae TaxID=326645 RepID=UPI001446B4A0|nr:Low molecular weight phosphotyrosine protein phosphatase [Daldinia childiae]KAF3058274.1 Low molecular weight phosphotyrosine protein phosphatase [Daldinia childiae]
MTSNIPMDQQKVSVLFVCLGNICRSTMAEGVFRSIVKDRSSPYYNLVDRVDSCGTGGYHTGDEPDSRTMSTLESHGITNYTHAARKLRDSDFREFDYIFAMDKANLEDLNRWRGRSKNPSSSKAQVMLFGEFSGTGRKEVVQDPYYVGQDAFEKAYEQCKRFSTNFLEQTFSDAGKTTMA